MPGRERGRPLARTSGLVPTHSPSQVCRLCGTVSHAPACPASTPAVFNAAHRAWEARNWLQKAPAPPPGPGRVHSCSWAKPEARKISQVPACLTRQLDEVASPDGALENGSPSRAAAPAFETWGEDRADFTGCRYLVCLCAESTKLVGTGLRSAQAQGRACVQEGRLGSSL